MVSYFSIDKSSFYACWPVCVFRSRVRFVLLYWCVIFSYACVRFLSCTSVAFVCVQIMLVIVYVWFVFRMHVVICVRMHVGVLRSRICDFCVCMCMCFVVFSFACCFFYVRGRFSFFLSEFEFVSSDCRCSCCCMHACYAHVCRWCLHFVCM